MAEAKKKKGEAAEEKGCCCKIVDETKKVFKEADWGGLLKDASYEMGRIASVVGKGASKFWNDLIG
ncbi:MAG: hypothetical protein HQL11_00320 [Candidatus Omnitrophica bacterium]|nr:hypothetical protein [Candidatus Omnitrophota bacterium]